MDIFSSFSDLTIGFSIEQLVIGYIMGVLVGMTGIGAGILAMPAMVFFAHLDSVTAIGTSLLFSVLSRAYGVAHHWKLGFIDKETDFFFSLGSVPMVLGTSVGVNHLKRVVDKAVLDFYLNSSIAVIMLVVTVYLVWDAFRKKQFHSYKCGDPLTHRQKVEGTLYGGAVGALVGATSIGGGIFIVPILMGVFKLSAKCVVGTSNMISVALTLVGSGVYLFYGNVNVAVALLVVAGSIPGIKLGADIANRLPNLVLKKVIAGLALVSFISMVAGIKH